MLTGPALTARGDGKPEGNCFPRCPQATHPPTPCAPVNITVQESVLRYLLRNTRAYQLFQFRYHLQRRAGSVAARRGARRVLEFAAQLQERQLRLFPGPPP